MSGGFSAARAASRLGESTRRLLKRPTTQSVNPPNYHAQSAVSPGIATSVITFFESALAAAILGAQ